MWLLVLRQDVKFARINVKWLDHQNRTSRKPIVAPGGPIVSLTTYGERIRTVYLTLESIAGGSILPSGIILWLDDLEAYMNPPQSLRRLQGRGLEIRLTADYGPHKKYYPFVESTDAFETPLVTADDDVLYPTGWLRSLVKSFDGNRAVIHCCRAHEITIVDGEIAPYRVWGPCQSAKPSFRNFAVGSSGRLYPPSFLRALKKAGRGFEQQCPTADDVWLHVNAIRAHFMIKQIERRPLNFPTLPETQDIGLCHSNVGLGQNDLQIKNTYTSSDVDALVSSERPGALHSAKLASRSSLYRSNRHNQAG
jgi:hypothetical protein